MTFTDAHVDVITGKKMMTAAMAYRDMSGLVRGVVAADSTLEVFK